MINAIAWQKMRVSSHMEESNLNDALLIISEGSFQ